MTKPILLEIPLALSQSLIIRRSAIVYGEVNAFSESEALELARELHAIVEAYLNFYSVRPPIRVVRPGTDEEDRDGEAMIEAVMPGDMVFAIILTALDYWPQDGRVAASDSVWLMAGLTDVDPTEELYHRYLRLSDKINNTDIADLFGDDDGGDDDDDDDGGPDRGGGERVRENAQ
jgi:hypothetical protein